MAVPIDEGRALPGEHLEEEVQDIACRAFLLLRPFQEEVVEAGVLGAAGDDGLELTADGCRAARQAYTLLIQAHRELLELQYGRDPGR